MAGINRGNKIFRACTSLKIVGGVGVERERESGKPGRAYPAAR